MTQIVEFGNQPEGGSVVIGEAVHFHVDERILIDKDKTDLAMLRPIGRPCDELIRDGTIRLKFGQNKDVL